MSKIYLEVVCDGLVDGWECVKVIWIHVRSQLDFLIRVKMWLVVEATKEGFMLMDGCDSGKWVHIGRKMIPKKNLYKKFDQNDITVVFF